jgi:hypothetical protein
VHRHHVVAGFERGYVFHGNKAVILDGNLVVRNPRHGNQSALRRFFLCEKRETHRRPVHLVVQRNQSHWVLQWTQIIPVPP